jgi:MipA family protein
MRQHLAALAFLLSVVPSAHAQFVPFYVLGSRPDATEVTAAGALIAGPKTDGSDRYRALVVPSIDVRFANGWFAGVINGVGYNFSTDPSWDFGLRLGVQFPRDDQDAIAGLDDIPLRVTTGAFGNIDLVPNKLQLRSALRYGSGLDRDGLTLDVGLEYRFDPFADLFWTFGGSVQWANAAHLQSFFGVSPAQSASTGLPAFEPGSGVREFRLELGAFYPIDRQWSAFGAISAIRFGSTIADSPVVRERNTGEMILGVLYRF